ncbi:phage integrase N-terminal SAM-like domain-containing protein [Colwellia sp. BRX8-7]|jgi:site-specific recombinase XerD|uniref:phage integrase N-terminal SAM-like domain-containing protein n=1 Tax=Colwellia sp. BRX8-7 TaxID=2759833 RepID=UPI0015F72E99|nr:phage integrase N-terminal SAM-like domain-containing protein [Colwellia sp. BRX8-7]MBA6338168.1 phage integrase N-terminal SAM-like domain-containing protein [Colwellia sp. BRX8-7]
MIFSTYFDPELSRRFTEDMVIRKLTAKTQIGYVRALNRLCEYLNRSPEDVTRDNLREFQLFLVEDGATGTTINCILSGLRYLYNVTLGKPQLLTKLITVSVARRLPIILSLEEIKLFLAAAAHPKYHAAFSVAYGAGLRVEQGK